MELNESAHLSITVKAKTGCGPVYLTVLFDSNGNPCRCIGQLGKSGGCAASQIESIARTMNIALKHGATIEELAKELAGIYCPNPTWDGNGGQHTSCADAIAKALQKSPAVYRELNIAGESAREIA